MIGLKGLKLVLFIQAKRIFYFKIKKKLKYTLNDKQLIKYGIDRKQYKKIILFACHAFLMHLIH